MKNLKFNETLDLYYDENDSGDSTAVKECIKNYSNFDYNGKVCLDVGANIGGFSTLALKNGAEKVISIECDERNFKLLEHNLKNKNNVELIYGAASNKNGTVSILKKMDSKRKNISVKMADAMYRKNSSYEEVCKVNSYDIYELINKYKPDILKVDIEGAEFLCFEDVNKKLDPCVKEMFLEVHLSKNHDLEKLRHILDQFKTHIIHEEIVFKRVSYLEIYLKDRN